MAALMAARAVRAWSSGGGASAKHAAPALGIGAQLENWYPGHMQKAIKDMQKRLKQVDLVLEVRDARVPFSACSPVMEGLLRGKRRILVLNKADLVPPQDLQLALRAMASRNCLRTLAVSANDPGSVKHLMRASLEVISTERATADESLLMVVGLPNAGKSSIINGLKAAAARSKLLDGHSAYGKKAKTGPLPGVTRALGSFQVSKQPRVFVLDTPGVLPPAIQDPLAALNIALTGGMPMTVTDSSMLVKHLVWLLLQHPQKHAQLIQEHLSGDARLELGEAHMLEAAVADVRSPDMPQAHEQQQHQQQQQHQHQHQHQQQPRRARTHRRTEQPNLSNMPAQKEESSAARWELGLPTHLGQLFLQQPLVASGQPALPFHKSCSSVAKALVEALGPPKRLPHAMQQHAQQATTTSAQGPEAPGSREASARHQGQQAVDDWDGPPDEAHARMHHLLVLLSRDSRRGAHGWGRLSLKVAEVPVSAAQRQDACDRVLWAFRKGQLGRLMLDDSPAKQQQQQR